MILFNFYLYSNSYTRAAILTDQSQHEHCICERVALFARPCWPHWCALSCANHALCTIRIQALHCQRWSNTFLLALISLSANNSGTLSLLLDRLGSRTGPFILCVTCVFAFCQRNSCQSAKFSVVGLTFLWSIRLSSWLYCGRL